MKYEYWLAALEGVSDKKKRMLRSYMDSAKGIYYIEETQLNQIQFLNEKERNTIRQAQKEWEIEQEYELLEKKRIQFIPCVNEAYPEKLKEIPDPPYAIYVKGNLPEASLPTVAMVGARRCTAYGEKYAYEFAKKLAEYGVQVISGLAEGIDGLSHRGALQGHGKTFAVLGNGVDICYPKAHIGLYSDIVEQGGGMISELCPGTKPLPFHFPRRNRIISGLSDLVLVMEAREKSGSLITADMALEQGKDVYALPGPLDSKLSFGCNQLIRQGAGILLSPEMLLEEMGILDISSQEKSGDMKKVLETNENLVYSSLGLYPKNAVQIMEETRLPAQEVMSILTSLMIRGLAKEKSKNYYIRGK